MAQTVTFDHWSVAYILVSFASTLMSLNVLLRPQSFYGLMPVAPPKDRQAQQLLRAQFLMFAAREITVGSICFGLWYLGDRRAMGWAMISCLPMAVLDGYALQKYAGGIGGAAGF
ncbi:hypothetical protein B0T25DRAFT_513840 [Lasiosphaeria hispida]|uniref:Uncharacterized protein n=1 Tax=Lasiosphaeria hispida TaxID=260671 RepID=A0AAJ0HW49_9PEZI|nr:hypothetical protein B0T25DRAFT_513840 [Lasiosphaeria hispida]